MTPEMSGFECTRGNSASGKLKLSSKLPYFLVAGLAVAVWANSSEQPHETELAAQQAAPPSLAR
ncbi:hypothetical protein FHX08_006167 [Rhizobium sp. BK529]|uniref:hypothetical protein n=1 Tax=unclassified Rhizobium TaxID=2613769 RepID=UPI00104B3876|nr:MULTISPECIES: hypothetical protein [unclassified Rhizobium]MBB3595750.1 hypothetical protein [Rhizobium sp. BK529]TCR98302.1 hypothetical protein EV281_109109 [Rhizobium sp. BK418]